VGDDEDSWLEPKDEIVLIILQVTGGVIDKENHLYILLGKKRGPKEASAVNDMGYFNIKGLSGRRSK